MVLMMFSFRHLQPSLAASARQLPSYETDAAVFTGGGGVGEGGA